MKNLELNQMGKIISIIKTILISQEKIDFVIIKNKIILNKKFFYNIIINLEKLIFIQIGKLAFWVNLFFTKHIEIKLRIIIKLKTNL